MKKGFTLVEMLIAVIIVALVTLTATMTYTNVMKGWREATDMVDKMQNADYAFHQIVAGIKSAYYPIDGQNDDNGRGLQLIDGGDGEDESESDWIEWTKLGTAIIGNKLEASQTAHKVRLWIEEPRVHGEQGGLWVKTWNAALVNENASSYDEENVGDEFLFVPDVVGFDCKIQKDPKSLENDGEPKWEETWDTSNAIPYRVKLTFRMKPTEEDKEPIPVMRVVTIPLWDVSQNPVSLSSESSRSASNKGGGGKGPQGPPGGGGPAR
jgi:prepilin-type N-terminal cleavage/methylation domain-containing protein